MLLNRRLAARPTSSPVCCVVPRPSSRADRGVSSKAQATTRQANRVPSLLPLDENYEANHEFADFANWLIPGHVMLGRYPFIEPSRCLTREQGEQQLTQLLEKADISTFVCLQDELPPQDQMKLNGKAGFMPYRSTAQLIQSSLNGPPPSEIINGLRNPTNNRWLPSNKRHELQYHPKELQFLHSPIVDLGLPSPDTLQLLLADLQQRLEAGEKLYIHCWGGRGRAGTVGACLLASMYGTPAAEALERVQRAFDTRRDGGRRSPETNAQFAFVAEYVATRVGQSQ